MSQSEANTREDLIDPALDTAGWNLKDPNQVRFEIPVDGYDAARSQGITDYCLYQRIVISVDMLDTGVEAHVRGG